MGKFMGGRLRMAVVALTTALAALAGACGGGNNSKVQEEFLQEMIPHHEAAVQMAEIALQRSQRPEIRQLAEEIKRDQNREIEQMKRLLGDKAGGGTSGMGHGGMSSAEGGEMTDMAADVERLRSAPEPFDRAFIDAMIAHHESAIKSANEVKDKAKDQEVKDLVRAIISAQEREIAQMREWRRQWFGA